jgi:murein L,D-transpeptidase YcbB/YkuD
MFLPPFIIISFLILIPFITGCAGVDRDVEARGALAYYGLPGEQYGMSESVECGAARDVLLALATCEDEGLRPEDYDFARLARTFREVPEGSDEVDAELTLGFAHFVHDIVYGVVEPRALGAGWERGDESEELTPLDLAVFFLPGGSRLYFEQIGPQDERFKRLRAALHRYRQIMKNGGWGVVTAPPDASALLARLRLDGDFSGTSRATARSEELADAVRQFQRRHGLAETGIADRKTLAALNVPVERRIAQIEFNMERWRWLPGELEPQRIEIDIPSFRAAVYEGWKLRSTMRAIVGKKSAPTPVLHGEIEWIELNPYWEVPRSIAVNELLPELKRDPGFLEREHFEVLTREGKRISAAVNWKVIDRDNFSYRIRQAPGPWNALGNMKLAFRNRYSIYLHGTPAQSLFAASCRNLSHGCVRVEDPITLALAALRGTGWTAEKLQDALATGKTQRISLPHPLPLYVTYWTAWVDDDGLLHFADDIYDGDERLEDALDEAHSEAAASKNLIRELESARPQSLLPSPAATPLWD